MKLSTLFLLLPFAQYCFASSGLPPFQQVPEKSIRYVLNAPPPFQNTEIIFLLDGTVDNRIDSITVTTEIEVFKIDSKQLDIDFSPNLNEIRFYHDTMQKEDAAIESIWFNVWHGAPEKIECGIDNYEYVQKAKKVTIKHGSKPLVQDDNSHKSSCERYTENEKRHPINEQK